MTDHFEANDPRTAVVVAMMAATSEARYDLLRELLADDVVLHVPYLHGDKPGAKGADNVHRYFERVMTKTFTSFTFVPVEAYPVTDGETVVMEYRSEGVFRATGEPYRNRYVGIFKVRDGKLASWREYFDPREAGVPLRRPEPT